MNACFMDVDMENKGRLMQKVIFSYVAYAYCDIEMKGR